MGRGRVGVQLNPARALEATIGALALAVVTLVSLAGMFLWMSDAVAVSTCPNASLRAGASLSLPDCRAYEQVSPTEKGGFPATTMGLTPVQVAPSGEGIAYLGNEAFPGALGNTALVAAHVSSHTETGWLTTEQTPPVPVAEVAKAYVVGYDFTEDLSETVLRVPLVALTADATPGVFNLFRRDPSGHYSLIDDAQPAVSAEEQCPPVLLSICFFIANVTAYAGASEDLSHVLFESTAQLTPEAPGPEIGNLYENSEGHVRLVGIMPDGNPAIGSTAGGGSSFEYTSTEQDIEGRLEHSISSDGTRVVFQAAADGGEPDSAQVGLPEVYDRIEGKETIELSAPAPGVTPANTPEPASFWTASSDGSKVFFTSTAALTKQSNTGSENNGADLYEYNVAKRTLVDLTVDTNPADAATGPMVQGVVDASSDGSYVYFVALGQMVQGEGVDGQPNLYVVHDGGSPTFIATLSSEGSCGFGGRHSADSCDWTPVPTNLEADVTPDGRHVAFMSTMSLPTANFPSGYNNVDQKTGEADSEVYEYSISTGDLVCVSCDPTGLQPNGNTLIGGIAQIRAASPGRFPYNGLSTPFRHMRALNDSGTRVFYDAPGPLGHPYSQVYEYEQRGEGSCETADGCQYLVSTPTSEPDFFLGTDTSGSNIFFATTSRLVTADKDNLRDVYDARVGGGFAAAVVPTDCENDCRTSSSLPAGTPPVLSGSADPSGNLTNPSTTTTKTISRAQKLAKALKSCRAKRNKHKRATCEARARRTYGKKKPAGKRATNHRRAQ
jgi:WD40-like Beta Propeller Repeat